MTEKMILVLYSVGSVAGTQVFDDSLWEKSAWVIMCICFGSTAVTCGRYIKSLHDLSMNEKTDRIRTLERENEQLRARIDQLFQDGKDK